MSKNNSGSGGISFLGALFLIFLTLKLIHYIDWSWWWVTAPLWGGFAFAVAIIVGLCAVGIIVISAAWSVYTITILLDKNR